MATQKVAKKGKGAGILLTGSGYLMMFDDYIDDFLPKILNQKANVIFESGRDIIQFYDANDNVIGCYVFEIDYQTYTPALDPTTFGTVVKAQ